MRRVILSLTLALLLIGHGLGADRRWTGADVANDNWSDVDNWDDGAGGAVGAIPTSSDAVTFSSAFNVPCVVDGADRVCASLTFNPGGAPYSSTITFTYGITVSGAITLEKDATYAGTDTLTTIVASTLTSDGEVLTIPVNIGGTLGTATFVMADNWSVTNLILSGSAAAVRTLTGNTISVAGNYAVTGITTGSLTGSTAIVMTGTGNVTSTLTSASLGNGLNWTINSSGGVITFVDTVRVGGRNSATSVTLTYTAGTIVEGTSNVVVKSGAYTITCNAAGMEFGTLTFNAPVTMSGAFGFTCDELISSITEGAATAGDIVSGWNFTSGYSTNNATVVDLNTFTVDVIGGRIWKATGVLTVGRSYRMNIVGTAGAGMTFRISDYNASVVYKDIAAGAFNETFDFTAAEARYLLRGLVATGTIGITSMTIYEIPTHTFASGEEYIVNDSLKLQGVSAAQPVVLKSSTADAVAYLTFNGFRNQSVSYTNPTDINSSLGGFRGRIYDIGGVIDNSANWYPRNASLALAGGGGGWGGRGDRAWGGVGAWGGR